MPETYRIMELNLEETGPRGRVVSGGLPIPKEIYDAMERAESPIVGTIQAYYWGDTLTLEEICKIRGVDLKGGSRE